MSDTVKKNRRVRTDSNLTAERFWKRVMRPVGCWLYDGAKEINGYGYLQNPFGSQPQYITAHRAAWIFTNGPIPEGMRVCHRCDIRACINPDHLFLGTDADNNADAIAKGRANRITRNKLTEEQVREIRRDYRKTSATSGNGRELARKYGVGTGTITEAARGATWTHVK